MTEEIKICNICSIREAAEKRNKCNTCRSRIWIDNNQLKYAWHMVKKGAKTRRLPFTLTFECFKMMALNIGYNGKDGRLFSSLTLERSEAAFGYHDSNCYFIKKHLNSQRKDKFQFSDEELAALPF